MTSSYRINYQLRAHKRDPFIEFIKGMLLTPFTLHSKPRYEDTQSVSETHDQNLKRYTEIMANIEVLINEHIVKQNQGLADHSQLFRLIPSIGSFFTPLPLKDAFLQANAKHSIAARRFVPPSFNDIRRMLNTAQASAIAPQLKLITFDGDMTLYDDGKDFAKDSELVLLLIELLRNNLYVAIVTAAGYGNAHIKYESRLSGLLEGFRQSQLTKEQLSRFYVLGGECNYLFQCTEYCRLQYIPEETYQPQEMRAWRQDHIQSLLDEAFKNIQQCVDDMKLPVSVMRKPKAVGLLPKPGVKIFREQLDECVLSTQASILEHQHAHNYTLPFCVFNGGSDVWVDIGNKLIGVQVLQHFLGAAPSETLHVGDQFLSTGNDYATRRACCTLWIVNPEETNQILIELTQLLNQHPNRSSPKIAAEESVNEN
ncbi:IMP-specific 5-nucleotidase [Basidiobolus meristosporus CBS 931.73]|uniref:IMP-specific 5'-nucleotidase 1 n=1 Tax=Basidiobolus meristosporus CBS 931.73 TaxID=1314790 RepID=A0A1Y1XZQ6_9FUNG|nr:IMP-specific 5-nucleotidase [Basidiobolus meristosporus CBS 931.73]|eukprot:ORX91198.1 IMP-specific 5-nucleotidase [Basidiobolus meristosporus CBS 931.73]